MFVLYFCVLQVLLVQMVNCYSIRINCGENSNTTIRITIPLTSEGIGEIRIAGDNGCNDSAARDTKGASDVDERDAEDTKIADSSNNDQKPGNTKLPSDSNVWEAGIVQIVGADNSDYFETGDLSVIEEAPIQKEVTFEGSVRASGNVNIAGQFGPVLPAQPPFTRLCRPIPYLNTYPITSYNPMQPSEVSYPDDEAINADASINQLLRNLFLLNAAYQSNIPCEVVPKVPSNEAPCESMEDEEDDDEDISGSEECDLNIFGGYLPAAGKVTLIGTSL